MINTSLFSLSPIYAAPQGLLAPTEEALLPQGPMDSYISGQAHRPDPALTFRPHHLPSPQSARHRQENDRLFASNWRKFHHGQRHELSHNEQRYLELQAQRRLELQAQPELPTF